MEQTITPRSAPRKPSADRPVWGLVLLASVAEPDRCGEVALVPPAPCRLGRAGAEPGEAVPHLELVRQRPGGAAATGPLRDPQLSREQLALEPGDDGLVVRNVGRAGLSVGGRAVTEVEAVEGTVLEVGDRLALLVVRRAPGWTGPEPTFGWAEADGFGLVGESPAMAALRRQLSFVGGRRDPVLVLGPSGSGKEAVAGAIHAISPRRRSTFLSRSAATLPEALIEAELFGNARGYPQAGMPERPGLVGEAEGGTLFLDEIGEMPEAMQTRLLRLMDRGEYHRLGDATARVADVRVIAATNRPAAALKHDLAARFVLRVEVPGLDQRAEDLPLLVRALCRAVAAEDPGAFAHLGLAPGQLPILPPSLMARLASHRWTGHVRELRAILLGALAAGESWILPDVDLEAPAAADPGDSLTAAHIQAVLDRHGGAQEPVWRELGLSSRHALARLVKKHGLVVRGRG